MLTLGMRLHRRPQAQRDLVAELDGLGVAALGFGEGVVFDAVPRTIIEEATARGFPVFVVPPETPFRDVIAATYRGSLSAGSSAFQRLTSMQRHLMDALGEEDPRETIVERLAWIVGGTVGLIAADGGTMVASGALPVQALRPLLVDQHHFLDVEVAGWSLLAAPVKVRTDDEPVWLVVGAKGGFARASAEPAVRATVALLVAVRRLDEAGVRRDRASRAALLEELLESGSASSPVELTHRARSFGLDFQDRTVGVIVRRRTHSSDGFADSDLSHRFLRRVEQLAIPHLAVIRPADIVAVVQARKAARLWSLFDEITAADGDALVAIGRDVRGVADIPPSINDAVLVGRRLAQPASGPQFGTVADLDLPGTLLAQTAQGSIESIVRGLLDGISERPVMLETLVSYFDHHLDVPATAEALYLHPNTLRYRLRQIETIVGASLRDPATVSALYLALEARKTGLG
ncbi:hypothetical protein GCM10022232_63510 [Streptomyces plumbiresistens]|uniref:PucR family transcriptional regulator n=2 Tax=Streptomyces plumbiresistens TaxID=511811 RepID=A0ABP7SJY4_9ACTN